MTEEMCYKEPKGCKVPLRGKKMKSQTRLSISDGFRLLHLDDPKVWEEVTRTAKIAKDATELPIEQNGWADTLHTTQPEPPIA